MTNPEFDQGGEDALLRQQEIFHEKVHLNELLINDLHKRGELNENITKGVAEDLDDNCPYMYKPVLISGRALVSTFDEGTGNITGMEWMDVEHTGIHLGVNILTNEEFDMQLIVQQVQVDTIQSRPLPTASQITTLFAFFDNDANITPIDEIEGVFHPYYMKEAEDEDIYKGFRDLVDFSSDFARMLRDTKFRRMDRKKQLSLVSSVISDISNTISISELEVIIQTQYCYAPVLRNERQVGVAAIAVDDCVISGTCMGVDSLERIRLPVQKIRSDKQLIDKYAGICIVIDPDESTRVGMDLLPDQVLFIPTASQSFEIEIIPTD